MPPSDPRSPTRKDFESFLPNQRLVRAFEQLFKIIPDSLQDIEINSELSSEKAQFALDAISNLAKAIELSSTNAAQLDELQQRIKSLEIDLSALNQRIEIIPPNIEPPLLTAAGISITYQTAPPKTVTVHNGIITSVI